MAKGLSKIDLEVTTMDFRDELDTKGPMDSKSIQSRSHGNLFRVIV